MRLRTLFISLLLTLAAAGTALAVHRITLHNTKNFTLAAGKTQTFKVSYPDALKFGGSTYSGRAQILPPATNAHGARPSVSKVRVLSKGSAAGGSAFAVKVRNGNRPGTAPVRVRITATTVLPPETNP
jgi:hypothetical protein